MRIHIVAVGKAKDAAERDLYARYATRFDGIGRGIGLGPVDLTELPESRAATTAERRRDEAARLAKPAGKAGLVVALDGGGKAMSSEAFAKWLGASRDKSPGTLAFLIGGPDGHDDSVLVSSALTLSLGPMTLPHGLARIVLAEQLYRAATILAGHPYHRA